jgi:hypothetical protein
MIRFGAPSHDEETSTIWGTREELGFLEDLGLHRRPAWLPTDGASPAEYRVRCLEGYLAAFDLRVLRGNLDWPRVKARALELLQEAKERAA